MHVTEQIPPADLGRSFERLRLATPSGLEWLRTSIRTEGIRSPIASVFLDGRAEVVDGFKRVRIAIELKLETVPVTTIVVPSRAAARASMLSLNSRARGLTGLDEALVIRSLAEEDGLTLAEVGELLGRDKSFCSRRLKLARDLDPAVIARVRDGSLAVSMGVLLAMLPRGNQLQLATTIVREGLSKRETERLLALYATVRGREAEILLAQPRAALGRPAAKSPGPAAGRARGLLDDVSRATELLARIARGLADLEGRDQDLGLGPALHALHAQILVVEARLDACTKEAGA